VHVSWPVYAAPQASQINGADYFAVAVEFDTVEWPQIDGSGANLVQA
jgi:hypothetical protein